MSIQTDQGPRRILFLVDFSKLPESGKNERAVAWKALLAAASYLAEEAREEDELALMTYGGLEEALPFSKDKAALRGKLATYATARPEGEGATKVRDALLAGLAAFGNSRFGDAIFILFAGEDTGSRAGIIEVRKALEASIVRIFGISFSFLYSGAIHNSVGPQGFSSAVVHGNDFLDLVHGSGGTIFIEGDQNPWSSYKLTPERLENVRLKTRRLYGQMIETYAARLNGPFQEKHKIEIELSAALEKKFPNLQVRYPRRVPRCL